MGTEALWVPAYFLAVGGAAATAYSANREASSAEKASQAQRDIASQQIAAEKQKETMAQDTATAKLKAARAKKSDTILTSPLGVGDENVNTQGTIGV